MIKTTKDGRIIRTGKDYTKFRRDLWESQNGNCSDCGRFTFLDTPLDFPQSFHVDHVHGRGLGGGKRDDTGASCKGRCCLCHRRKHGQS